MQVLQESGLCYHKSTQLISKREWWHTSTTLFAEMCQLLGTKKTRTTPYHPASDGMVERFNQTLEAQLSKCAGHNHRDWDLHVPFLMMAYYCSAEHDWTGCSPSKMMLGRELKLPVDLLIFGRPEEEPHQGTNDYARALQSPPLSEKAPWNHVKQNEAEAWSANGSTTITRGRYSMVT